LSDTLKSARLISAISALYVKLFRIADKGLALCQAVLS
jgi:hypothetical protein